MSKKYCRYCASCFLGDWYYCSELDKPLKQVNRAVNCDSFTLSEFGDVDTGKPYKPHIKTVYEGEQMRFEEVEKNESEESGNE